MRRMLMVLLAMLLAMGVAACGEDSSSDEGASDDAAQSSDAAGVKDAPNVSAGSGSEDKTAAGGGTKLVLAVKAGTLEFEQPKLSTKAGTVMLLLTNPDATQHNIAIEDVDGRLLGEGELVDSGGTSTVTAKLEPGTYTYFCTPHKGAGMTGTLTVN